MGRVGTSSSGGNVTITSGNNSANVNPDGSLDVNIVNSALTLTVDAIQSGVWTVQQGTPPWSVSQSGSWNILNITGTISLPTGASTSALQTTANTSLSSIDSKLTSPLSVAQSGAWTTGRTWNLSSLTDSVSISNFPASLSVTQGTSPWVVSGAVTANAGTGNFTVVQPTGANLHVVVDSGTVAATQSGSWSILNITGTIVLPTGASTSALQTTGNSSLSSIDGKTPTLGQKTSAGSSPVVIASDQSAIPSSQSGTWNINNISGTISLPTGAATSALQTTANASLVSIDSKLTSPLTTIVAEDSNPFNDSGYVATAAAATTNVMATAYGYVGSNSGVAIQSNSANDALAGTGAQKITVTYFKADGSGPFNETISLQGTTIVFAVNTMAFIQRVVVSQVGSGGANAGIILISSLAPLATLASIAVGDNETYYAHHFVPLGKTCYVTDFSYASSATSAGQGAKFQLKKHSIPTASSAILAVSSFLNLVGSSSTNVIAFTTPVKVVGPAIIQTFVTPDSSTANTFYAAIGGYEV